MIDKVKKYLLRHNEINFYKKNDSGSEYYMVGNSIIRVSDHLAVSNNRPDALNIVVSGDNFVVMYGNRVINVNDYEDFKKFLKYHIQMCDCFKDIINKGLFGTENSTPKTVRHTTPKITPVKRKKPLKGKKPFLYKGEGFDVSDLTDTQVKSLYKLLDTGFFPKRSSVIRTIQNYRDLNAGIK